MKLTQSVDGNKEGETRSTKSHEASQTGFALFRVASWIVLSDEPARQHLTPRHLRVKIAERPTTLRF
jgi:hypothetical protein